MRFTRWPFSAILIWSASWLTFLALAELGASATVCTGSALLLSTACVSFIESSTRKCIVVAGAALSIMMSGVTQGAITPSVYTWLALFAFAATIYPTKAWRDAPFFPTPKNSLCLLPSVVRLPNGARIIDAGCGLGHGLSCLRDAYPDASLFGVEGSWLLKLICAIRCPWATIRQDDMWTSSWRKYDLVYLFQRPESIDRAIIKAQEELSEGGWVVSLEFKAASFSPFSVLRTKQGKTLWVYKI